MVSKTSKFNLVLLLSTLCCSPRLAGQVIPQQWEGKWSGSVKAWTYNQQIDSFAMSIDILPKDSTWNFTIFYDRKRGDQPDIRRYELLVVDESKYHLAIDEKNSIMLDCFVNDNCLYNRFAGMGSDLQMRICINETEMEYEISSYYSQNIRVSGNEVVQSDTIPEIKSYELNYLMKGKLKKIVD